MAKAADYIEVQSSKYLQNEYEIWSQTTVLLTHQTQRSRSRSINCHDFEAVISVNDLPKCLRQLPRDREYLISTGDRVTGTVILHPAPPACVTEKRCCVSGGDWGNKTGCFPVVPRPTLIAGSLSEESHFLFFFFFFNLPIPARAWLAHCQVLPGQQSSRAARDLAYPVLCCVWNTARHTGGQQRVLVQMSNQEATLGRWAHTERPSGLTPEGTDLF